MKPPVEYWTHRPVESLLPHTPPLVLIDRIVQLEQDAITCEVNFPNDGFFRDSAGIPVAWSVEILAQACALFVSIQCYGTGITQGRLLKCRCFEFFTSHLPYESLLKVSTKLTMAGDSGLWFFTGDLRDANGTVFASGEMSIKVQ